MKIWNCIQLAKQKQQQKQRNEKKIDRNLNWTQTTINIKYDDDSNNSDNFFPLLSRKNSNTN